MPRKPSDIKKAHLDTSDIESVHDELIALYEKDRELQKQTLKNLKTRLARLDDEKMRIYRKLMLGEIHADNRERWHSN